MPRDEAKALMKTDEFSKFLTKSSRYIERALGAEFFFNSEFFIDEGDLAEEESRSKLITKKFAFHSDDEMNHIVTSLDWSQTTPELFLASYIKQENNNMEQTGHINIYSIAMPTRPELQLKCNQEVTKAIFSPFN